LQGINNDLADHSDRLGGIRKIKFKRILKFSFSARKEKDIFAEAIVKALPQMSGNPAQNWQVLGFYERMVSYGLVKE
jgi:hypothetical protein